MFEHSATARRLIASILFLGLALPGPAPAIAELDMPLMWNDAHNGWIAHIWLWMHNSDGMFENFNPDVPLCECEINPGQALCT